MLVSGRVLEKTQAIHGRKKRIQIYSGFAKKDGKILQVIGPIPVMALELTYSPS